MKVAGFAAFHGFRAWGVVGGDKVDEAFAQRLPELVAIFGVTDGRGAFVEGAAVGDVFGGEVEVVRAGFDGDGETVFFGLTDVVERLGGGEVHDVEAEAVFAA